MKQKTLLLLVLAVPVTALQAQSPKTKTGYAITATEKGGRSWRDVRLVDISSGADLKTIYNSREETEPLNARTGKPVVKKDQVMSKQVTTTVNPAPVERKVVNLDQVLDRPNHPDHSYARIYVVRQPVSPDKPFSTNSAALAYDKKHDRLYYTPMSINQLRYIDLKSGKIFYFEDEAFGRVRPGGDVANQVTRMVIASDGNGYALTNDANHLIRFTTGKKPTITDLGALTDDAANSRFSVHSGSLYGGDMVADASGNLYLVTANRNVFKINIETKAATHKGSIKGLPPGFSTNGAMVEEGSKVIIASSESTTGYYRFDLNTLQAEKLSADGDVYNASDLANGNLAFDTKKDRKEAATRKETAPVVSEDLVKKVQPDETTLKNGIAVFPNPVTNGVIRLSFSEQPAGKYQVQLLDLSGRLITSKEIMINGPAQVESFSFPELSVKGSYLVRVSGESNKVNVTSKIVVQ